MSDDAGELHPLYRYFREGVFNVIIA